MDIEAEAAATAVGAIMPEPLVAAAAGGGGGGGGPLPPPRKKMFRFCARDDIELLKAVILEDPYRAGHGYVLHRWESVCAKMRALGMNVDHRRCRDRANLLLQQYREKEYELLHRSGTQEEYLEKERLLHTLSQAIETPPESHPPERKRTKLTNPLSAAVHGHTNGSVTKTEESMASSLFPYLERLEQRLTDHLELSKRQMELEKQRAEWEIEREKKRLELQREQMEREHQDRKADREETAKRWEAERQERSTLMRLIIDLHRSRSA